MQIEIKVFTEEEKYLVHQRTMELLSQTGVWIKSDKAFFALKEAGASIDEKRRIVYFTEEMVQRALAAAPKQFVLGRAKPALRLPAAVKGKPPSDERYHYQHLRSLYRAAAGIYESGRGQRGQDFSACGDRRRLLDWLQRWRRTRKNPLSP